MKIKLANVRLAFPQLFEAKTVNGEGKPAHSAAFLFAPDHPVVKEIKDGIEKVGAAKWGAKWPAIKKAMEAADKTALHNGDTKSEYAGYEGMLFVNARNEQRPTVLDRDKSPLTAADGRPYAGCYVNAVVELWAQDNNYGKRINASLMGVQFFKDGDAFSGGGVADADEFDSIEEGADAVDDLA
jgi:hypothetical protein